VNGNANAERWLEGELAIVPPCHAHRVQSAGQKGALARKLVVLRVTNMS
jgi:hypothetical protein